MKAPSLDQWLKEAKQDERAEKCGMYLFHNGVVRSTAKAEVRMGAEDAAPVTGMEFHYNADRVAEAEKEARFIMSVCGLTKECWKLGMTLCLC